MPNLFENYRAAVLDASFFVNKFSDNVKEGLKAVSVYVADTFNAEIEQYREVLPLSKRGAYEENIAFLKEAKQIKVLNMASFGEKSKGLHNDVWGVLTVFVGMNASFVLVTANKVLIQRVILRDLKVDIFDLGSDELIRHSEFSSYRAKVELELETPLPWGNVQVREGSPLYRKNGTPIVLGQNIKTGGEARLFLVAGNSGLIVKVFHEGKLASDKYKSISKIADINKTLDISWALFPIDVVFYDEKCTLPAGFTEGFAQTKRDLGDNPLYAGDAAYLSDVEWDTPVSFGLEMCLKVVRQVRYLNTYGFLVSDFNQGNFAERYTDDRHLQMWDTDSFGYEHYFGGYCARDSKTSREYDISKKIGAIDFCAEALYVSIFSMLSLGCTPISEFSGKFKFDNPQCATKHFKKLFPSNLWDLFAAVFRCEKEPSIEELLYQLHVALQNCKDYPVYDKSYKQLMSADIEKDKQENKVKTESFKKDLKKTSTDGDISGAANGGFSNSISGAAFGGSSGLANNNAGGPSGNNGSEGAGALLFVIIFVAFIALLVWLGNM